MYSAFIFMQTKEKLIHFGQKKNCTQSYPPPLLYLPPVVQVKVNINKSLPTYN